MDHARPLGLAAIGFPLRAQRWSVALERHGLIPRFSEDIDILIHPDIDDLPTAKNHNKPAHTEARRLFYDSLSAKIMIPGISEVERDESIR